MNYFPRILLAGLVLTASPVRADDPIVPSAGFHVSRYETLWTKSPFAVATTEETAVETSPEYELVGFANNIEGVSYASVIDKQKNDEHFLISTDKSNRGLTLTSISRSPDGADIFASVQKDGQTLTLKLEQASPAPTVPGAPNPGQTAQPGGIVPQQIIMPGANPNPMNFGNRPFTRVHRPLIHLPPPPAQPVQTNPSPPPQ